jgi:hypothetical protein
MTDRIGLTSGDEIDYRQFRWSAIAIRSETTRCIAFEADGVTFIVVPLKAICCSKRIEPAG